MQRVSARAVLMNTRGQVLLLKTHDETSADPLAPLRGATWTTIGGACKAGETLEEALHREIHKESGITDAKIQKILWERERHFNWKGVDFLALESYFLVTTSAEELNFLSTRQDEQASHTDFKWWDIGDLVSSKESILPRGLGKLIELTTSFEATKPLKMYW